MADADDGFLARWSRQKVETKEKPADRQEAGGVAEAAPGQGEIDAAKQAEIVAELPDIESLDETSDFSVFMKEGVPQALRRRALRKLWRINPLFANLDGLNDYDDDFTDAAMVVEGMQTLFKVGKGMVQPEAEAETAETDPPRAQDEPGEAAPDPAEQDDATASSGTTEPNRLESPAEPPETLGQSEQVAPTTAAAVKPGSRRSARARRWGESKT